MDKYFYQMEDESEEENNSELKNKNDDEADYQFEGYVIEVNTVIALTPASQLQ